MNSPASKYNALDNGNRWRPIAELPKKHYHNPALRVDVITADDNHHLTINVLADDLCDLVDSAEAKYFYRLSNKFSSYGFPKPDQVEVPVAVKFAEPEWMLFNIKTHVVLRATDEVQLMYRNANVSVWMNNRLALQLCNSYTDTITHYRIRPIAAPIVTPNSSKSIDSTSEKPKVVSDQMWKTRTRDEIVADMRGLFDAYWDSKFDEIKATLNR